MFVEPERLPFGVDFDTLLLSSSRVQANKRKSDTQQSHAAKRARDHVPDDQIACN